jgi:N-acetylglutamate synthase-like GNAT family acetyltransferase
LVALGHVATGDEKTALAALIEQFTIFEHRQFAEGVGALPAGPAQAGELTLF